MFGRRLSVEVFDSTGQSVFLVDPEQDSPLLCSGTIEYLPSSSGSPRATIQVYNLPATLSSSIFSSVRTVLDEETGNSVQVDDPKMIRVSFGYTDEDDGKLSVIFVGRIVRAFSTRYDAVTTVTKIYAYQLSNFYTSSVSSAQFDAGTSVYDVVAGLLENATVQGVDCEIPEALKNYFIDSPISFYAKTLDCLESILGKVNYLVCPTPLGLSIVSATPSVAQLDVVVLAAYDESGKISACSGLIGYPNIDTEGMRFETLINPNINLYSYVWIPNQLIVDNRDGFPGEVSTQFGAGYDPAGIYRVVKMTTRFNSHAGECKTEYLAMMAGASSAYYQ